MLACVRALADERGGFVTAIGGEPRADPAFAHRRPALDGRPPTPFAISSMKSTERRVSLGCRLAAPFGTLSFLALPVIPELRIATRGSFQVDEQRFIKLLNEYWP